MVKPTAVHIKSTFLQLHAYYGCRDTPFQFIPVLIYSQYLDQAEDVSFDLDVVSFSSELRLTADERTLVTEERERP